MTWLASHWGWLAGGGALTVLGVLAALNPAAALKLASSLVGFVLDKLRAAVQWLRKERTAEEKWRMACMALGTVCLLASFVAWDARQTIVIVREKCALEVAQQQVMVEEAQAASKVNAAAVQQCAVRLQTEVGKRQEIERIAREAVASAKRGEDKAEAALEAWQAKNATKPAGCVAALKQVEAQCPTLRDY